MSIKVRGARGRDRAIALLRSARAGQVCTILPDPRVEFLVRFTGRWMAVERNRVRRRLRGIFRALVTEDALKDGVAVVLRARREWLTCRSSIMKEQVWTYMKKEMRLKQ